MVFTGTFTAGGLEDEVNDGRLRIRKEGKERKFVERVEHLTFSGRVAAAKGQLVLYVTERCVFRLRPEGLALVEVAPGIDIASDILARMGFAPIVSSPRLMDERIFHPSAMGLREELLQVPLDQRLVYDPQQDLFFVNLSRLSLTSRGQILVYSGAPFAAGGLAARLARRDGSRHRAPGTRPSRPPTATLTMSPCALLEHERQRRAAEEEHAADVHR